MLSCMCLSLKLRIKHVKEIKKRERDRIHYMCILCLYVGMCVCEAVLLIGVFYVYGYGEREIGYTMCILCLYVGVCVCV